MDAAQLPLVISIASLTLSIISLVLTYRQKSRQDQFAARKALTDAVAAIAQTNAEFVKYIGLPSELATAARRNLNSQRRYLANHAEMLTQEIPNLSTDIDHQLIAGAFEAGGDFSRATYHWTASVEKAPGPFLKAVNLRGFARFLFGQGNCELGRQKYQESLTQDVYDSDRTRYLKAETLILWAIAERTYGFDQEAERRRSQAVVEAQRIGVVRDRDKLKEYIATVWSSDPKSVAAVIAPQAEPGPT